MGPGAPGFAPAYLIADTGKLSLAHATLKSHVSVHERDYADSPYTAENFFST